MRGCTLLCSCCVGSCAAVVLSFQHYLAECLHATDACQRSGTRAQPGSTQDPPQTHTRHTLCTGGMRRAASGACCARAPHNNDNGRSGGPGPHGGAACSPCARRISKLVGALAFERDDDCIPIRAPTTRPCRPRLAATSCAAKRSPHANCHVHVVEPNRPTQRTQQTYNRRNAFFPIAMPPLLPQFQCCLERGGRGNFRRRVALRSTLEYGEAGVLWRVGRTNSA